MSGCWAMDGPCTRSMMPLHRGLREQARDAKNGGGRSGHLRCPALLSHQVGLRAARVLPARRATLTAGPPSRLAARQGVGVYRSFRAAAAVPSRGRRWPCARSGPRQARALPLLRAAAWPGRSGSPPAFRCAAPARGPLPAAAGPGRPLAAGGPCAAVAAAGIGAGRFCARSRSRCGVAPWGRGPGSNPPGGIVQCHPPGW